MTEKNRAGANRLPRLLSTRLRFLAFVYRASDILAVSAAGVASRASSQLCRLRLLSDHETKRLPLFQASRTAVEDGRFRLNGEFPSNGRMRGALSFV